MKSILYATDCSKHSISQLKYAYQFSQLQGAELVVLHIFKLPPIQVATIRSPKQLSIMAAEEKLEVLQRYCDQHLSDKADNDNVRTKVLEGDSVAPAILQYANELNTDLVIVGMKDAHSSRGFFSGNIANFLLENLASSLLIIPHNYQFSKLNNLIYATDFEASDIEAINKLVSFAKPHEATVLVVHIPTPGEYAGADQMEWFKELLAQEVSYPHLEFHMLVANSVPEGLRLFSKEVQADLIGMLEREERGLLKKLFHKDLIKKMESLVNIPILSFNT